MVPALALLSADLQEGGQLGAKASTLACLGAHSNCCERHWTWYCFAPQGCSYVRPGGEDIRRQSIKNTRLHHGWNGVVGGGNGRHHRGETQGKMLETCRLLGLFVSLLVAFLVMSLLPGMLAKPLWPPVNCQCR